MYNWKALLTQNPTRIAITVLSIVTALNIAGVISVSEDLKDALLLCTVNILGLFWVADKYTGTSPEGPQESSASADEDIKL